MPRCASFFWILSVSLCSWAKELPTGYDDPVIGTEKGALHIVVSTECFKSYFVYQTLALKYTFARVRQPGNLTRIISCDDAEAKSNLSPEDLSVTDTLVVPNWKQHPVTGDYYQPYNRPVGVLFWLSIRKPRAEWTLILDPDMLFLQPFLLEEFSVPEGFALAAHYNYLRGTSNALADQHISGIPKKTDHYGGPVGRRADEAGAFMLLRTRDLAKLAPLWLRYTEEVRANPRAWNLTGDTTAASDGQKPWIAEMYGYVFAAAKIGLRHKLEPTVQYYPGYPVYDFPILVHYGLPHRVGDYVFSKHEHFEFDPLRCPPWNMSADRPRDQDAGLFPHPPWPDVVVETDPRERYGQLMVIEFVNIINKALCQRHRAKCREQIQEVNQACARVDSIASELEAAYGALRRPGVLCRDDSTTCGRWSEGDGCEKTWLYMTERCRVSCAKCREWRPVYASTADSASDVDLEACLRMELPALVEDPWCRTLVAQGRMSTDKFVGAHLRTVQNAPDPAFPLLPAVVISVVSLTLFAAYVTRCRSVKYRTRLRR